MNKNVLLNKKRRYIFTINRLQRATSAPLRDVSLFLKSVAKVCKVFQTCKKIASFFHFLVLCYLYQ